MDSSPKSEGNTISKRSTCTKCDVLVYFIILGIAFAAFHISNHYYLKSNIPIQTQDNITEKITEKRSMGYWIYVGNHSNVHMKTIETVIKRYGMVPVNGSLDSDWDLMWSWIYPFNLKVLENLKPHQRVNHIPGNAHLISKSIMTANTNSKYVPKAFTNENKFREYAKLHPTKRFVQKHVANRGVQLRSVDEIEFTNKSFFVQEFIENPLLNDGYAFDMGVYAIITSIHPLRIYSYTGEILIRHCPLKYHPFNASNVDQYVISSSYTVAWQVPSIAKYLGKRELHYSFKEAFNVRLQELGHDTDLIWDQIEDAIATIALEKEHFFIEAVKQFLKCDKCDK